MAAGSLGGGVSGSPDVASTRRLLGIPGGASRLPGLPGRKRNLARPPRLPRWKPVRKPGTLACPNCPEREREGASLEAETPPTPSRKKSSTTQYGDPDPCPYMGIRKHLVRLPYVITSEFSPGRRADPVAERLCAPFRWAEPPLKGSAPRMCGANQTILRRFLEKRLEIGFLGAIALSGG